jgi:hypothetical protein
MFASAQISRTFDLEKFQNQNCFHQGTFWLKIPVQGQSPGSQGLVLLLALAEGWKLPYSNGFRINHQWRYRKPQQANFKIRKFHKLLKENRK